MNKYHLVTINTNIDILEDYRYVYVYYSLCYSGVRTLWCLYDPIYDSHQFTAGDIDYVIVKNLSEKDITMLVLCNSYIKEIHPTTMSPKLIQVMDLET